MNLKTLTGWAGGSHNLAAVDRLPEGHIREGVNVDCLPDGTVRVRHGRQLIESLDKATGAIAYGNNMLIADNGSLRLFSEATNTITTLGSVPPAGAFCGAELNGELFVCTESGRLRVAGDKVLQWGMDDAMASLTVIDGGMPAGVYRIAVVGIAADGLASGSTPLIVSLDAGKGLQVESTIPDGADRLALYATVANGDTLYYQQDGTGPFTLLQEPRSDTARLMTENLTAPPLGDQVIAHNAQLLIVRGSVLHYTEPFMPHHTSRFKNFIAFAAPISVVVSLDSVIYVCADKTYAIRGLGTSEQSAIPVFDFGAVKGTGLRLSDKKAAWLTRYGQAFADESGAVTLPTKTKYAPPLSTHGTSSHVESDGLSLVVNTLRGQVQTNGLGLKDEYDLEII